MSAIYQPHIGLILASALDLEGWRRELEGWRKGPGVMKKRAGGGGMELEEGTWRDGKASCRGAGGIEV